MGSLIYLNSEGTFAGFSLEPQKNILQTEEYIPSGKSLLTRIHEHIYIMSLAVTIVSEDVKGCAVSTGGPECG